MLLFKPEDKVIGRTKYSEIRGEEGICYQSSVKEVKARLDNIGLSIEKLQTAVKKLSIVSDRVVDYIPTYFSEEKNLRKLLEGDEEKTDFPEDIGFLLYEFDEEPRYSPIGHLWLLRLLCEYLEEATQIVLDPNQVLDTWDIKDITEVDLHKELLRRFAEEIDTYNQLFQMILMPVDDAQILEILHALKEDELINDVVVPLLEEMGFKFVSSVTHHGIGELGKDIKPFYAENAFGIREYYAVQTKATRIHSTSGKKGHVNEVIDQMKTALIMPFLDPSDNAQKRIDHFLVITSHDFTVDARKQIEEIVKGKREVMPINDQMLIRFLKKYSGTLRKLIIKFSSRF